MGVLPYDVWDELKDADSRTSFLTKLLQDVRNAAVSSKEDDSKTETDKSTGSAGLTSAKSQDKSSETLPSQDTNKSDNSATLGESNNETLAPKKLESPCV